MSWPCWSTSVPDARSQGDSSVSVVVGRHVLRLAIHGPWLPHVSRRPGTASFRRSTTSAAVDSANRNEESADIAPLDADEYVVAYARLQPLAMGRRGEDSLTCSLIHHSQPWFSEDRSLADRPGQHHIGLVQELHPRPRKRVRGNPPRVQIPPPPPGGPMRVWNRG